MVTCVDLKWFLQMAGKVRVDDDLRQLAVAVDAADQQWRLTVLVLRIDVHAAADEELGGVDPVVLARQMKRCRERGVQDIRFGLRPLEQHHQRLCVPEGRSLVDDAVTARVVQLGLLQLLAIFLREFVKIDGHLLRMVQLDGSPELGVPASDIASVSYHLPCQVLRSDV